MNQVPLLLMELDPTHYQAKPMPPRDCPCVGLDGNHIPLCFKGNTQEDPYDFYEDSLGG